MRLLLALMIALLCSSGCARMVVKKDPGPRDKGVRFYRPKPYLFIGPGGAPESKPASKGAGAEEIQAEVARLTAAVQANGSAEPGVSEQLQKLQTRLDRVLQQLSLIEGKLGDPGPTLQPISIRLEYLPDYNEEYSVKVTPGLGTAKLTAQLQNGWNLTSLNVETDQQYDEIIGSVAELVGSVGKFAGAGGTGTDGLAESNVPMGYYEAVIARNECGRKEMMGWRYVGFMPCQTCPVKAHVQRNQAICDDDHMYALTVVGGVLRMKKMGDMKTKLACPDCVWPETIPVPLGPMTSDAQ